MSTGREHQVAAETGLRWAGVPAGREPNDRSGTGRVLTWHWNGQRNSLPQGLAGTLRTACLPRVPSPLRLLQGPSAPLLRRPLLARLLLRRQFLGALPCTTLAACSRPRLPPREARGVGCSQPFPLPLMVSSTFTLINLRQRVCRAAPL